MTEQLLENAIKRALQCEINQFGGIVSAAELEYNAYTGLASALAPYYRFYNYRTRIDKVLDNFAETKGKRYKSNSKVFKDMADEINTLINDIEQDETIILK